MKAIQAHVRSAGEGVPVLCLHSSAGSGNQWQLLAEGMGDRYRLIMPDLIGYGRTSAWPNERKLSLVDEVDSLAEAIGGDEPFHLVGHSFGAAVALELAARIPSRIRTLTLYEPVRFHLLGDDAGSSGMLAEPIELSRDVHRFVAEGDLVGAAHRFVGYWSGEKAWGKLNAQQQERVAAYMPQVVFDFDAVLGSTVKLESFRKLTMPTLLIAGAKSPSVTHRITRLLVETIPGALFVIAPAAGHMGPVTHARLINPVIEAFIEQRSFCPIPIAMVSSSLAFAHVGPQNYERSA